METMPTDPGRLWTFTVLPGIIFGNLAWFQIVRIVRSRGVDIPRFGGHATILAHFHRIALAEPQANRRYQYWLLLAVAYASVGAMINWVIAAVRAS
jgi:hypothetical protein